MPFYFRLLWSRHIDFLLDLLCFCLFLLRSVCRQQWPVAARAALPHRPRGRAQAPRRRPSHAPPPAQHFRLSLFGRSGICNTGYRMLNSCLGSFSIISNTVDNVCKYLV